MFFTETCCPIPTGQIPGCIFAELLERVGRAKAQALLLSRHVSRYREKHTMENRALPWSKNSHWTASPDSQYQQQQFVQVERLILVTVNTGDNGNPLQRGYEGGSQLLSWHSTPCTETELGGTGLSSVSLPPVTGIYTASYGDSMHPLRKGHALDSHCPSELLRLENLFLVQGKQTRSFLL